MIRRISIPVASVSPINLSYFSNLVLVIVLSALHEKPWSMGIKKATIGSWQSRQAPYLALSDTSQCVVDAT